jgi:hypothetical protein
MTTMREIFEGRWDAAMMAHAMGVSAGRPKEGSLAERVGNLEQQAANLEAADAKRGKAARKALAAVAAAAAKAEAFFAENAAPKIVLIFTDSMGNKSTIVVTGTRVWAYGGAGDGGTPYALSNFTYMMRTTGGYADREEALRDSLLSAYRRSGGDAEAVRAAAAKTTENPHAWAIKRGA